jgi:hypothetical protein
MQVAVRCKTSVIAWLSFIGQKRLLIYCCRFWLTLTSQVLHGR